MLGVVGGAPGNRAPIPIPLVRQSIGDMVSQFCAKLFDFFNHFAAESKLDRSPSRPAVVVRSRFRIDVLNRLHDDWAKSSLIDHVMFLVWLPFGSRSIMQKKEPLFSNYWESEHNLLDFVLDVFVTVITFRYCRVRHGGKNVGPLAIQSPCIGNIFRNSFSVIVRNE